MRDTLSQIDQKILQLKQKKEKLQTQQALAFFKEAQKIFSSDEFSIELALSVLSHAWNSASDKQKEEWKKSSLTFPSSNHRDRKKTLKVAAANS